MIYSVGRPCTVADVCVDLGIDEKDAALVHHACGGQLGLIRCVVDTAATTGKSLAELVGSNEMADFLVGPAADVELPIGIADRRALQVFSLLGRVDIEVARVAYETAADHWDDLPWDSVHGIVLRLQVAGILNENPGPTWQVPSLLAAWARREWAERESPERLSELARLIAESLTVQIELVKSASPEVVDNAVALARHARAWSLLDRIFASCGYPLFYRYPRSSIEAFARLPTSALQSCPGLNEVTTVAAMLLEAVVGDSETLDSEWVRFQTARLTGPGIMKHGRAHSSAVVDRTDLNASERADDPAKAFHFVLSAMSALAASGEHREAADLGAAWVPSDLGRRPRIVVRMHAARYSLLAGDPRRALALLRSVEDEVCADSLAGDHLPLTVKAWSALSAYIAGDVEQADAKLDEFASFDNPPVVEEFWFRPPALIAEAYRCLDRLELPAADRIVRLLRNYPDLYVLWVHEHVISRLASQISSLSLPALRQSEEAISVRASGAPLGAEETGKLGNQMLFDSEVRMLISLGQVYRAEALLSKGTTSSGARHVMRARSELIAGRVDAAMDIINAQFYESVVNTRQRAELMGLRAIATLRKGDFVAARRAFVEHLELCIWAGTLVPVVALPSADRIRLLDSIADEPVRDRVEESFAGQSGSAVWGRMRSLGAALVDRVDSPVLGDREKAMLDFLSDGATIAEIAKKLSLVEGTVKNNLSSLYRKLGANGRDGAVARAHLLGYLGDT